MAAEIDPVLQAELNRRPALPIDVEIDFSGSPTVKDLEAAGMKIEGNKAFGPLSFERIEAIARVAGVLAICLSRRPARTDFELDQALADPGRTWFDVTVTFRPGVVALPGIPQLSVHGSTGHGRLTRDQVMQLIQRPEVLEIDTPPENELH